jgi:hypothetical protein
MRLAEIKLPADSKGMMIFGKELTLNFRKLAAEFNITIDGGVGGAAHGGLPLARKDYLLLGGWLRPKAGVKGEAAQIIEFEKRVELFLKKLHGELGRLQVHGLGDDLGLNFHVYIGTSIARDGSGMKRVDNTSAEEWFKMLAFAPDHRKLPGARVTWMIAK